MATRFGEADDDGDKLMVPTSATIEYLAGSLREHRDRFKSEQSEVEMTDAFDQSESCQDLDRIRLLVLDTNILIGHLSLVEWVADILVEARKLGRGSGYRCGLLIPKMVRAEIDKHKMPHNKTQPVTAILEPTPSRPNFSQEHSIHSPQARRNSFKLGTTEAVRISLAEAADRAVKWMTRLYQKTPANYEVIKFQTRHEVLDHTLTSIKDQKNLLMSPDDHILDCALYFKRQVEPSGGGVVLLTNDKALGLDAEIEGINTLKIQHGFTAHTLISHFDPALSEDIEELADRVNFHQMIMYDLYRKSTNSRAASSAEALHHNSSSQKRNTPQSPHSNRRRSLPPPEENKMGPVPVHPENGRAIVESFWGQVQGNFQMTDNSQGNGMDIEIDDLHPTNLPMMPVFPRLLEDYFLIVAPLPSPPLLYLHHHIKQSVAFLLRRKLFDNLLKNLANDVLEDVFKIVVSTLERRQFSFSGLRNDSSLKRDPNQWTAVECLKIIDELWIDGTSKIFSSSEGEEEEEDFGEGHEKSEDRNGGEKDDGFSEFREFKEKIKKSQAPIEGGSSGKRKLDSYSKSPTLESSLTKRALIDSRWANSTMGRRRLMEDGSGEDGERGGEGEGGRGRDLRKRSSCRLRKIRRAVQVLITRLESFSIDGGLGDLPRDNPLSWSISFWDSLIDDVHLLIRSSKVFEDLELDVNGHGDSDDGDYNDDDDGGGGKVGIRRRRSFRRRRVETKVICNWKDQVRKLLVQQP